MPIGHGAIRWTAARTANVPYYCIAPGGPNLRHLMPLDGAGPARQAVNYPAYKAGHLERQ
jgi:hypothetical protein